MITASVMKELDEYPGQYSVLIKLLIVAGNEKLCKI